VHAVAGFGLKNSGRLEYIELSH